MSLKFTKFCLLCNFLHFLNRTQMLSMVIVVEKFQITVSLLVAAEEEAL